MRTLSKLRLQLSRLISKPSYSYEVNASDQADRTVQRLVITGANGAVATALRPLLSPLFAEVVLSDLDEPSKLAANEVFQRGDLGRLEDLMVVTKGADAILHLGGGSQELDFEILKEANLLGIRNIFEAARQNRVNRMVFASSLHTHGFYSRGESFDEFSTPRPDSLYAATKLFGEATAYVYAQKCGIRTACIRIGAIGSDAQSTEPGCWISDKDLADLVLIGLTHPDIRYEIFHGLSHHKNAPWLKLRGRLFGYDPAEADET